MVPLKSTRMAISFVLRFYFSSSFGHSGSHHMMALDVDAVTVAMVISAMDKIAMTLCFI